MTAPTQRDDAETRTATRAGGYRLAEQTRLRARLQGNAPALSGAGVHLTYRQLDDRTSRLANVLRDRGIRAGDRIAVLGRSSTEIIETVLAAAKIGAVTVPVNWRLSVRELGEVVADARARLIVCHRDFLDSVAEIRSNATTLIEPIVYGDPRQARSYEQLVATASSSDPGHVGDADDVVLQLYTSGTTGRPKGVLTSNTNLGACTQAGGPWGFDESSVSLCAMPLFHIGGLGWALVGLANGAHNIVISDFTPESLLDTLVGERVTNVFLVPTVIGMLVDVPGAERADVGALRSIAYGSAPITPALLRRTLRTFGTPLFQVYGLTETHGAVTQLDAEDHSTDPDRAHLLRSVGRPYPWVELSIRTASGKDAPRGEQGEICVRTPQATRGYHRRDAETAATIDPDGWLHTGDIGRIDADGYVYVTDRLKDMIITGGENVYPTEVEAVLGDHPGVAQVAVVGLPHDTWGEVVTAFVVAAPGHEATAADLRAFARTRLAGYKVPKAVHVVDTLPLGATGKILKRALREQFATPPGPVGSTPTPPDQ